MGKSKEENCSFCGRSKNEVEILLTGQSGNICNNCIEQGHEMIQREIYGVDVTKPKKRDKGGTPKLRSETSSGAKEISGSLHHWAR